MSNCDQCKHQRIEHDETLGFIDLWCGKRHWEGDSTPPERAGDEYDPTWDNCLDFELKPAFKAAQR